MYLKSLGLRMTPSKRVLIQFFLDNQMRHVPLKELQAFMRKSLPRVDYTTVYRNIEKFVELGVIQKLELPRTGKVYQYVYGKKVQHYYICKACGRANKGDQKLFTQIERTLKEIHGFSKAHLSVVFYGPCARCSRLEPSCEKQELGFSGLRERCWNPNNFIRIPTVLSEGTGTGREFDSFESSNRASSGPSKFVRRPSSRIRTKPSAANSRPGSRCRPP